MAVDPSSALRSGGLTLDLYQKEKKTNERSDWLEPSYTQSRQNPYRLCQPPRRLGRKRTIDSKPSGYFFMVLIEQFLRTSSTLEGGGRHPKMPLLLAYSPIAQPRAGRANQNPPKGGRAGARKSGTVTAAVYWRGDAKSARALPNESP